MAAQKTVERVSDPAEREGCPECNGRLQTDDSRGETSCLDCGLIVETQHIDRGPTWYRGTGRNDPNDGNPQRHVGAPTSVRMHDKGLATNIGWDDQDAYGNTLSGSKRRQLSRLRKWDSQSKIGTKFDRYTMDGLLAVQRIGCQLGVNDSVIDRACRLFKEGHQAGLCVGRTLEGPVAASVLAACREHGHIVTADEIAELTPDLTRRELWRAHHPLVSETSAKPVLIEPVEHVPRIASELGLDDETRQVAESMCIKAADEALHSGRKPAGIAAGAIYLAGLKTGERPTQEATAEAADVTPVTLRGQKDRLKAAGFMGGDP